MPDILPSEELRAALRSIGIQDRCHARRFLCRILREAIGASSESEPADELARRLVTIHRHGMLGRIDPARLGCE